MDEGNVDKPQIDLSLDNVAYLSEEKRTEAKPAMRQVWTECIRV